MSKRPAALRILRLLVRMDKAMLALNLLLLGVGLAFLYGVGREQGSAVAGRWFRQFLLAGVGLAGYLLAAALDYRRLARWSWVLYLVSLVVLLLVLTPLGEVRNGARSWLSLPGVGIPLQPSELVKPAILLFVAWLAALPILREHPDRGALPCLIAVLPPVLLIALQPDFGTAVVYIPTVLAVVFMAGLRWRWILLGTTLVLLAMPLVYPRLREYQKDRIKVFLDTPTSMALAAVAPVLPQRLSERLDQRKEAFFRLSSDSWNAHQSLLAVGSGGMWGKGFLQGTQHVLGFLPRNVASSDFIFSVIGEETGFVGAAGILCAFMGVLLCALRTAAQARDDLGKYLAVGVAVILFTHVFINVGMTVQAAPIIGIPLPFISHGGSFLLCTMVCCGLVQSVHVRRHGNR
ncbi:MAG: rod shape-determining protein RodA [Lentisphaeria bacterium]|nr:rod shape-determining protein RodA [Lentisphaeria bacterium]